MHNPYKTLGSKLVYKNAWMRVREDKIITPEGTPGIYGVVESDDSVMITVLDDNNRVYLIRTFNYPAQSWNWELPGGGSDGEDTIVASKRELLEETGITAKDWTFLGKTRVCNGLMTERMSVYLARNLSAAAKSNEAIVGEGNFFSLVDIHKMIHAGDINDGQSLTGLYLLELWLKARPQ